MKIAAVTQNGKTLASHFGMAPFYHVFTVEDGQIVADVQVDKYHHEAHPEHDSNNDGHHGHDHAEFFTPISDCQVLLCGGMGEPAYQRALAAGLEVVMTGGLIEDAVQLYLSGQLSSDPRRIHRH